MSSQEATKEVFNYVYRDRQGSTMNHLEMKEDGFFRNRKPRIFSIDFSADREVQWTHEMIGILFDLFFHFHEKRIIWEELQIDVHCSNLSFTRLLLHAVNSMNIFKKMDLSFQFDDEDDDFEFDEDSEEHNNLCPGITSNKFIECIELFIEGKMTRGHCLALNNLLQTNAPCLQKLSLLELSDSASRWIVPGLRDNKTLKKVELGFIYIDEVDMADASTSEIVAAVTRIPSLESLIFNLKGNVNYGGDLTSEAFRRLLSESNSLRELEIYSYELQPTFNTECFIQGLKNSRSLKRFSCLGALSGDLIFARLFRILPDCASLENLRFSSFGSLLSVEDLVQVKLFPRLPRPIILEFHEESSVDDGVDIGGQVGLFAELLRYHPEVRLSYASIYIDISKYSDEGYMINLNWYGRYLLDRPNVPLSIWPLVLEKVNRNKRLGKEDKASIIYELLKGPACGGRISFSRRGD